MRHDTADREQPLSDALSRRGPDATQTSHSKDEALPWLLRLFIWPDPLTRKKRLAYRRDETEAPAMRLPSVRFTVRRMMVIVAAAAFGLGAWVWWHRGPPSPHARALELAGSVPTSSHYEATAIYQAVLFHEQVAPGSLTRLAQLPSVQVSRIDDGQPLPLGWRVTFADRRSGKLFPTRCFFGLSVVNAYVASARGDRPPAKTAAVSSRQNRRSKKPVAGGATPGPSTKLDDLPR
jgi:hypothetical protein